MTFDFAIGPLKELDLRDTVSPLMNFLEFIFFMTVNQVVLAMTWLYYFQ